MADMAGFSHLVECDELGTLMRQRDHRRDLIDPTVAAAGGRIVKTTGDGMMVEFASPRSAVRAAIDIQIGMAEREADQPADTRILYRVGVHVGEVVDLDGDLLGDDVNVAARLEQMTEPGGVSLSDILHQMVHSHMPESFCDLGSQSVKNISRPVRVWQWTPQSRDRYSDPNDLSATQKIGFCSGADDVRLAYASVGSGIPVYKMPNWLNHLEHDWKSPIWGPMLQAIARDHHFVRFDQRGNGLSDWDVEEISEDAMQRDVDTVMAASGLGQFAVFGASQGCAIAARFAARHPERVRCMVLYGGFLRGALRRDLPDEQELHAAMTRVVRSGWGAVSPAFRHMFTELMLPSGSPAQKASFDELQRVASSADNAARIGDMNAATDVSDLARQIQAPVLVMHSEGDKRVPIEEGRYMAAQIPDAQFLTLPGDNHLLLPGTPAYDVFLRQFREFTAKHAG